VREKQVICICADKSLAWPDKREKYMNFIG